MKIISLPDLNYLKECFTIDSSIPNGLRWNSDRPISHFEKTRGHNIWKAKFSNKQAGRTSDSHNYYHVFVKGKNYLNHRIIYALHNNTTDIGNNLIDHIDGNKFNNHPTNLRIATFSQNNRNSKLYKNNQLGCKYIYFHNRDKKYVVCYRLNRKLISCGSYPTLEKAIEARDEKMKNAGDNFTKL